MAREITPLERYQNTRVAIGEMLAGLFSGDAAEDALLLERLAGYRKPAHIPLEKLGHVYAVLKAEKAACESLGKDTYEDTLSVEQKAALYMAAASNVMEGAKAGGMQEKTCSWHTFRALLNEAIKGVPRQEREAAIKGMAGPPQKAPPKKKKAAKAATKKKTFVPPYPGRGGGVLQGPEQWYKPAALHRLLRGSRMDRQQGRAGAELEAAGNQLGAVWSSGQSGDGGTWAEYPAGG